MKAQTERSPGELMADRCKCVAVNEVVFILPNASVNDIEIRIVGAESEQAARLRLEALMKFLVEGELG